MTTERNETRAFLDREIPEGMRKYLEAEQGLKIPEGMTAKELLDMRIQQMAEDGDAEAQRLADKYGIRWAHE